MTSARESMTNPYEITAGTHGPRMTLHGPWTPAIQQIALAANIVELELNYAKGWHGEYEFLKHLPQLRALDIIDWTTNDVSAVNQLWLLRDLKVSTYCKTELNFTNFPELEECSLEWRPKAASLFECATLKNLFINKYPGKSFEQFHKLTELEYVSLKSPRLESFRGIEKLAKLRFLGVYRVRKLAALDGVDTLQNLEELEIDTCPLIEDIQPVARLSKLRRLHICNMRNIRSLRPIEGLKNLESVLFYESTNIVDGDLSPLTKLPRLKQVAFMERRHYSHKRTDFPDEPTPSAWA